MSAGAPWSVKGIDPKAREVAKDLARRSGMTLGEWLNRVILEDDLPEDVTAESQFSERTQRASQDLPRLSAVPTSSDMARIAFALDRVTDRIEASETRTGLAINGVEHSVRQALTRIEIAEREQHAVAGRLEGLVAESSDQQTYFSDRLRRLEAEAIGPRSPEALRAMEGRIAETEPETVAEIVLQRLGDRLATAEARTAAALEEFRSSLGSLGQRLGSLERGAGEDVDLKFERLGEALTQRVEAVRAEVVQKLEASVGPGFEARMTAMAHTVRQAELRSTRAVEEIGRQVLSMAEAVGRKLSDVDQRGADAIDQVGSEVARIAGAVELRLARSEHTQAEAFERLSAELGRVTEALGERPPASEPRQTPTLDRVATDMSRFRAAMDAALPLDLEPEPELAAPSEIKPAPEPEPELSIPPAFMPEPEVAAQTEAEPEVEPEFAAQAEIKPEPERAVPSEPAPELDVQTAALLEEARQRLGPPPEPEPESEATLAALADGGPFGAELFSRAETETETDTATAAVVPEEIDPEPDEPSETIDAPWRRLDFEASEGDIPEVFAPINESEDEDLFAPSEPQLSTREVIDRARAAARESGVKPVEMQAKISGRAASGRLFQGFGAKPAPRRQNSALQTALMVAGGAAFLSVGAAGLTLMQEPVGESRTAELSPLGTTPRAAIALASGGLAPAGTANRPGAAPVYTQVRADVEAGTPGAVTQLKALAESGDTQAQVYLAQLYDLGEAGLPIDPIESRRLIGLAAESGDAHAMHNLGVFYFRGEGGTQDLASAAQWFRKAAAAGVVESQYNLGLLYQSGSGVKRDLAQARQWFEQAAAKGDGEARRALAEMASRPAPAKPLAAATVSPPRSAPTATASQNIRQTQLILARLGYYEGPADGVGGASYRAALAEYQRDQADQRTGPRPYAAQR